MATVKLLNTPIKIKPVILFNIFVLWGGVTLFGLYQHPERSIWQALVIGFFATILLLVADIGHAIAHIISARIANAPMIEILLSAGMPRTMYSEHEVSPRAHRLRATGGPIFSGLGLLLSAAAYGILAGSSIGRELAGWSMVGHGFILVGSLLPLPFVDGGAIIKWTFVEKGKTEPEADEILRRFALALGVFGCAVGLSLFVFQIWIAGLISLGVGVVAFGSAAGVIR